MQIFVYKGPVSRDFRPYGFLLIKKNWALDLHGKYVIAPMVSITAMRQNFIHV